MGHEEIFEAALEIVKVSPIAILGSNGPDGYPEVKAMLKMENEGLKSIWFSTNTSSKRVALLRKDPKACIYFVDMKGWKGLSLTGTIEVLQDEASKKKIWRAGFEKYYPLGLNDPDYCVLRFTAIKGNYYHNLRNTDFEVR